MAQNTNEIQAVYVGHPDVGDDKVDFVHIEQVEGLPSGTRRNDRVTERFQDRLK